jgi:ABC-2 type transport system ATP-binding protein
MQSTYPPIELVHAVKRFGTVQALHDASFRIIDGERACLLGPNGAGKTTIMRLLTGAFMPTSGDVRLYGMTADVRSFLDTKRRVGVVSQAPGMYRDMSVAAYLRLVRSLYGQGDIVDVVAGFRLEPYLDRSMAQLSGGVQRRMALAAALLPQPDLLLLDEPTVGLDPVAAREMHAYLRAAMQNRTMLLCTHNLAEAEALCDSVVILRHGRVLLHESFAMLRGRTQPQLVLTAAEGPQRLAHTLTQWGCAPTIASGQVLLPVADPQCDAPPLLRRLLAADLNIYACQVRVPTLEELFLDIVGATNAYA